MALDQVSNSKQLQILVSVPNADAGWWIEAYDKTNVTRTAIDMHVLEAFFKPVMNSIGTGYIDVPKDDPAIDLLISTETKTTTLLRVYLDDQVRYVFFADNHSYAYDEYGKATASRIQGFGMEVVAERSVIGNRDAPASPSLNPTWKYGSNENFVENPSFDNNTTHIKNGGGEDGNTANGEVEGWTKFGNEIVSAKAVRNPGNSRLGDWYIEMDASDYHNGYRQSVSVTPGRRYHVISYAKDPTAAGMRVTMSLGGADDMTSTGEYANNYEYKQKWYAELGNVARHPSGTGIPGGATDGTWQRMDIAVVTGDEQTSLEISIQSDHHGTFTDVPFWIEDVTIEGWGLGLEPWVAFDPGTHAIDSFLQDDDVAFDSSEASCRISATGRFAGIEQLLSLNPSTKYTASIWGSMPLVLPGDSWRLEMIANDGNGTLLGSSDNKPPAAGGPWENWEVVVTTPADDQEVEVFFRYVYTGTNDPGIIYVDSASCVPGEPPSPAGTIINDVLVNIRARGELSSSWFQTSFSDTTDSRGRPWHAPLSMDIDPSETLNGLLSRMVALGHEWNIVPINFEEGGDSGFMLNIYNSRGIDPDSGLGVNWELQLDAPMIMPSDATIGGRLSENVNLPNRIFVAGNDGIWTVVEQDDFSAYETAFGAISEFITAGSAVDGTTLAEYGASRLAELRDAEHIVQLNMQRSAVMRPFLTFGIGASVPVDMPPDFTPTDYQRIRAISTTLKGGGSDINFVVDMSKVLYQDEAALFAKIAQLSERSPSDTQGQGAGRVSGGTTSVVSGAPGTGDNTGAHQHSLIGTEITDTTLQGDVSGVLPGPVRVNALKGIQFDSSVPTDDGTMTVLEYDRNAKQFGISTVGAAALIDLDDLSDVNAPTPVDQYIIAWDSGASEWVGVEQRFDRDADTNFDATAGIVTKTAPWTANQFDGLIDWLGTTRGLLAFNNPDTITKAVVTSGINSVASNAVDQGSEPSFRTSEGVGSWWKIDFGATKQIRLERFGILGATSSSWQPRIFRIEGSNDDSVWTTLIDVDGTIVTSTVGNGTWDSWVTQETTPAKWRYLRVWNYGLDSSGNNRLYIGDVEVWGEFFDPTPATVKVGDVAVFTGIEWVPFEFTEETTWNDQSDPLVVTTGGSLHRIYAIDDRDLLSVHASVSTANSGGTTTFDVKIDGTSILSTPLVIADLANESSITEPDAITRWNAGSYMTVEIPIAGGGAGKATVTVKWRRRLDT